MSDIHEVREFLSTEHGLATISVQHIRRGSQMTIAIRRGWAWRSVTGPADIIGPDEHRVAIVVSPDRVLGNG